ncbi:hypothetical protein [Ammoniphilus sp. CFH 90114]|uniref:hypothetical protein n=1 Tax=Ammoniphilus sp. CFH 90114 TaxID=2493665 RepID=UPI00100DA00F|nr:hypothetical protein [Ammoniphilus sp. CFH 90114]RXT01542.1 hypothetical protein EIZ39_25440 [Ammoniphilus sp. CFH 90114]
MSLTLAHWAYALVTIVVIVTMLMRRGVVIPTLVGTMLVGWIYKGSLIDGLKSIFNANLIAAKELFSIFLIIMFMVGLLKALKDLGSDKKMLAPIEKVMVNGHVAFFVLGLVTFVISLFFWPTPAIPLIGALLIPAAIRAGLPAMGAAMIVAIAGQGMSISSDYVMQVAPMLSATAAGIETSLVSQKALVLSFVVGLTAIAIAYISLAKSIRKRDDHSIESELNKLGVSTAQHEIAAASEVIDREEQAAMDRWGHVFAVLVPLSLLTVVLIMVLSKTGAFNLGGFEGGDGAAFIGGVGAILLVLATLAFGRAKALDRISDHVTEGFIFAFKAMGPVIPIAGFFFLGSGDFSATILSLGDDAVKPAFLFDLVSAGQSIIPQNAFLTAFGILIVGMITGLDGSGFSGLPLTGGLAGAMAPGSGLDPATLAAIGQMGAVWTGGGTLIAWSSLVAVAGFAGVSVIELARRNFFPVVTGLVLATLVALVIW